MSEKPLDSSNLYMTNFEWYAKNIDNLSRLLQAVQDDALEAKGCSLNLTLPPGDPQDVISWEAWLSKYCDFEI